MDVVALRKASVYFRMMILEGALELLREYSTGAAGHVRAVSIHLRFRAFGIWQSYAHQRWTLSHVAAARDLTLLACWVFRFRLYAEEHSIAVASKFH